MLLIFINILLPFHCNQLRKGFDVPAANVVISFDHMKDSVELCQRFGRARQEDSSKVVMDERRDRGVTRLQQVKQRQNGIIQEFDPSKVSQSQKTDMAAQKSREKMRRVFIREKSRV